MLRKWQKVAEYHCAGEPEPTVDGLAYTMSLSELMTEYESVTIHFTEPSAKHFPSEVCDCSRPENFLGRKPFHCAAQQAIVFDVTFD